MNNQINFKKTIILSMMSLLPQNPIKCLSFFKTATIGTLAFISYKATLHVASMPLNIKMQMTFINSTQELIKKYEDCINRVYTKKLKNCAKDEKKQVEIKQEKEILIHSLNALKEKFQYLKSNPSRINFKNTHNWSEIGVLSIQAQNFIDASIGY